MYRLQHLGLLLHLGPRDRRMGSSVSKSHSPIYFLHERVRFHRLRFYPFRDARSRVSNPLLARPHTQIVRDHRTQQGRSPELTGAGRILQSARENPRPLFRKPAPQGEWSEPRCRCDHGDHALEYRLSRTGRRAAGKITVVRIRESGLLQHVSPLGWEHINLTHRRLHMAHQ